MIQYIKIAIASLISGIFSSLPVSSSAHFSLLNSVMNIYNDSEAPGFYFSVISIVCALFMLFYVRKIHIKAVGSIFKHEKTNAGSAYKKMIVNTLISLLAALVLFIPYSDGKFLFEVYSKNLSRDNMLVSAFCCFAGGLLLLVAVRYAAHKGGGKHRQSKTPDIVRFTLYQIPANIFPGFSRVANGAASLVMGNIEEGVIMRELYLYTCWPMLILGAARIAKYLLSGAVVDYVATAVCAVFAAVGCAVVFPLISRINIRKLFLFFAVYSLIFGAFMVGATFII